MIFSLVALVIGLAYPQVSAPAAVMALGFCLIACVFVLGALSIGGYWGDLNAGDRSLIVVGHSLDDRKASLIREAGKPHPNPLRLNGYRSRSRALDSYGGAFSLLFPA